ncbi:MAG: VWA domain-containing protein [Myxococcota bacterium]|nr:VWA domain-containing protein [Myxococcota bacterium]
MKPASSFSRGALLGAAGIVSVVVATGCAGLQLTTIKSAERKPSNVAVYFKVQTGGGDPVAGLTAEQFRIYEDGQLVSQYESKQTILNPAVAASHYTLLLVDMSGSVREGGNADAIVQAVSAFTDRVEKQQRVGIYAFDGGPDLYPIVPFTDQAGNARAGARQLATFKPKDPSTNLNGAVVRALDELDNALARAPQPLKFGTIVVFTDGTDRANRVPVDTMLQRVRDKPFDVYAIGLGGEIKAGQLSEIGKSGTAMAADKTAIVKAFDEVGARVEARTRSFYLLSYCSPSRAGKHVVRVEAVFKDPKGQSDRTGSLSSDFDATGFQPGCDPNTPPSFDVTRGDALVAAASEKSAPDAHDKDSQGKGRDDKHGDKRGDRRDKREKPEDKREAKPSGKIAAEPASQLPPPPRPSPAHESNGPAPPPEKQQDFTP